MLHTLISYLSRFSRLVLLTFALVVVLILVLFTIDSASDNDSTSVDSSTGSSSSEEGEVATEQSYTYDQTTDETSTEPALVVINSGSAANSTDTATGNPQSFTANTIDLDSGDTITVITTDESTQAALEAGLEGGHVSSTSTNLPSTGIGSTVAAALGLMAITAAGAGFMRSKKNLSYELLEFNR